MAQRESPPHWTQTMKANSSPGRSGAAKPSGSPAGRTDAAKPTANVKAELAGHAANKSQPFRPVPTLPEAEATKGELDALRSSTDSMTSDLVDRWKRREESSGRQSPPVPVLSSPLKSRSRNIPAAFEPAPAPALAPAPAPAPGASERPPTRPQANEPPAPSPTATSPTRKAAEPASTPQKIARLLAEVFDDDEQEGAVTTSPKATVEVELETDDEGELVQKGPKLSKLQKFLGQTPTPPQLESGSTLASGSGSGSPTWASKAQRQQQEQHRPLSPVDVHQHLLEKYPHLTPPAPPKETETTQTETQTSGANEVRRDARSRWSSIRRSVTDAGPSSHGSGSEERRENKVKNEIWQRFAHLEPTQVSKSIDTGGNEDNFDYDDGRGRAAGGGDGDDGHGSYGSLLGTMGMKSIRTPRGTPSPTVASTSLDSAPNSAPSSAPAAVGPSNISPQWSDYGGHEPDPSPPSARSRWSSLRRSVTDAGYHEEQESPAEVISQGTAAKAAARFGETLKMGSKPIPIPPPPPPPVYVSTTAQTEPFYRPLYLRLLLDLVIFLVLIVGGCVYDRSQRAAIESMIESHRAKVAMREVAAAFGESGEGAQQLCRNGNRAGAGKRAAQPPPPPSRIRPLLLLRPDDAYDINGYLASGDGGGGYSYYLHTTPVPTSIVPNAASTSVPASAVLMTPQPVVLRAEIEATAGRDLFKRATTGKVQWMKSPSASASASAASAMYTHELRLDETTSRLEVIEVGTGRITWQSILSATKSSMLHHGPEHAVNESTVLVDAGQLRLRGGVVEWTPVL